uniref:Uncharacterized protein n=1 Tax=Anguilla anguilla TaxID=7936 RepID=A0A0E9W6D6_ANGAN
MACNHNAKRGSQGERKKNKTKKEGRKPITITVEEIFAA